MSKKRVIQVFEFDRIKVGSTYDGVQFKQKDLDALALYLEKEKRPLFELTYKGVRFKNYVGVIQAGDLSIEVLPKADKNLTVESTEESKEAYKKYLLEFLKRTSTLKLSLSKEASLSLRRFTLLDIYIDAFLNEALYLKRCGLCKSYNQVEQNLEAIKGQIVFPKHIRKNYIHKERVYVKAQEYNFEHTLNRIISQALNVLPNLNINPLLTDKLSRVLVEWPEVKPIRVTTATLNRLSFERKTAHYETAVNLAVLILQNLSPDIISGKFKVFTLMFDMNLLWERFVYKELYRSQKEGGYTVRAQTGRHFWERKQIRPDIVLRKDTKTYVIDTKWKVLEKPDPSDADLKQMFAYNHYFDCTKSVLLYPETKDRETRNGSYKRDLYTRVFNDGESHGCTVAFLNPFSDSGLSKTIHKDILKFL